MLILILIVNMLFVKHFMLIVLFDWLSGIDHFLLGLRCLRHVSFGSPVAEPRFSSRFYHLW